MYSSMWNAVTRFHAMSGCAVESASKVSFCEATGAKRTLASPFSLKSRGNACSGGNAKLAA